MKGGGKSLQSRKVKDTKREIYAGQPGGRRFEQRAIAGGKKTPPALHVGQPQLSDKAGMQIALTHVTAWRLPHKFAATYVTQRKKSSAHPFCKPITDIVTSLLNSVTPRSHDNNLLKRLLQTAHSPRKSTRPALDTVIFSSDRVAL